MKKKIILALVALVAVSFGVVGLSAYEAHILNVTANIENSLTVPLETTGMSFGTVFPEEVMYKNFDIQLSSSFLTEPRVDDVEYLIRQKPKCGVPADPATDPVSYSSFAQVTDGPGGAFLCPPGSVMLPLLCPYLSKHEVDGTGGIEAFHGPLTGWDLQDTIDTELSGRLSKADGKTAASYVIDLHAPCFQGMCSQDNVIPAGYEADPAYEGQMFGCDLWIEVTDISIPPDRALLTVIKHVINDNGKNNVASDFIMSITGTNVSDPTVPGTESPGIDVVLGAGTYSVDETGPSGYTKTLGTNCSGTIAIGEHKTCTVTNDDNAPEVGTLTVTKIVNGGTKTVGDFPLFVDGMSVSSGVATTTSAGSHTVSETTDPDYTAVFSGDCDSSNHVVDVPVSGSATCTITNTLKGGTITVIKEVSNPGNLSGVHVANDFTMRIDGSDVLQNTPIPVSAGNHTVSEANNFGYDVTYSTECPGGVVNVPPNGDVTCTVINTVPFGTITVNKVVINNNGGNKVISDFNLFVGSTGVSSGADKNFALGTYTVTESGVFGYQATFSGDCDKDTQQISVGAGEHKYCTITNDDIPPLISLVKSVINNNGGTKVPTDFIMKVDGVPVPTGGSKSVTANANHQITEDAMPGYSFISIVGTGCPASLPGNVNLTPGQSITCTITNDDN